MEGYIEIKVTQELKTKVEKLIEGLDDKNKPKGYTLSEKKHRWTNRYIVHPKQNNRCSKNSQITLVYLQRF